MSDNENLSEYKTIDLDDFGDYATANIFDLDSNDTTNSSMDEMLDDATGRFVFRYRKRNEVTGEYEIFEVWNEDEQRPVALHECVVQRERAEAGHRILHISYDKFSVDDKLKLRKVSGKYIRTNAIEKIDFTTDKVNRKTWNRWANLEPGQLALGFAEDGSGSIGIDLASARDKKHGVQRVTTYCIDFEKLEDAGIAPRLEPYDKRVYEALSSLWNRVTTVTGQDTFSLKDIHYAMGFKSNLGANAKKKINDSITKMSTAHISIDNINEASAYNYPRFKWDSTLLPMERLTGYVDGQLTEGLIHLFREPPLFTFARERGQLTSYSVQLLQTPLSKTNKNIATEDYLREQIAWMRNEGNSSKRSHKITFADMFEETRTTRRDDKHRQRKNARKVLEHYVKCGWIQDFEETADGFTVSC